jgi:ketosteroid isomerase-like protein
MMPDKSLPTLVDFWQTLTPTSLQQLGTHYTEDASFRDPFNAVKGLPAIRKIFEEMFERLVDPRFTVTEVIASGDSAFLVWEFSFGIRALKPQHIRRIHGGTHLRFAPDGRVCAHRDYWDAAGELYAQLPVLGPLMRTLARWFA